MNAEQLHAIARELDEVAIKTNALPLLAELAQALQQLVNQPQQPAHQTKVQEVRDRLVTSLKESEYNEWAINRFQIAHEIGARELFGNVLADRINQSFLQNAATPEVIRQDIAKIQQELESFDGALKGLIKSFDNFSIEFEAIDPGEGEIGIVIPREIGEGLSDFAKDLRRIDFELKTLSRVVTGSAENAQIRTISSSDFTVFLGALPEIVTVVSNVVSSLRFGYEKLQELKRVLSKLRELGNSSDTTIESLEEDVEKAMKTEVANVISALQPMYETAVKNGLADGGFDVSLESTIKGISSRIDKGYSFSFRIGPPKIQNEEEPTDEEKKQLKMAEQVSDNNQRLQQVQKIEPGQQVLPLEWQTPDPIDDDEGTA